MGRHLTLHDPEEARGYYASGLWQHDTLYGLAKRWADVRGQSIAVRDPWRALSWVDLVAEADRVASDLHNSGVSRGDRVSVWMGNRVEAVAIFLACSRNGYVFNTSIHQTYTVEEVIELLARVRSRALFAEVAFGADSATADIFEQVRTLPGLRAAFAVTGRDGQSASPDLVRPYLDQTAGRLPPEDTNPDKVVYLAFTSGTTGSPKGVMHSDNTLLANGRAMVADWKHDAKSVLVCLSQMSHHIGTVALEQVLVGGFELALTDPRSGLSAVDWIMNCQATYVMGVPTHAIDILAEIQKRGIPDLGSVRTFYMAGAPIPQELAQRMLKIGITPQNVYGMTENGSHQYTLPHDSIDTITGTCGRACGAYEIKLFSSLDWNEPVSVGEEGEIGGRGAMRMLGYFDNQIATEDSFNADGWFMSGDLGRLDAHGNLEIVGRSKDIIIRGGHNIHPAKIEDLAMRHPQVLKAAAVAVQDERLGERAGLIVTLAGETVPTADEILQHLHECGLSRFDMPEYFAIVDALPLGPTGKILKREIALQISRNAFTIEAVRWKAKESGIA